jgi:hypothetical protein
MHDLEEALYKLDQLGWSSNFSTAIGICESYGSASRFAA